MNLPLRRHYLRIATEHIDRQIAELREKRADISIEVQRIDRRMLPEIPVMEPVNRKCRMVEVEG